MGNVLTSVKRFLANKNTVTILGVLLAILVLYIGYNYRVKQATTPVTVPYAKEELSSRTLITADMIGYMEVSSSVVKNSPNLITNASEIINNYVSYGATIPENGMFYKNLVKTKAEQPDSAFNGLPDGYAPYSLSVNLHDTYANSIFPGNYIDLYFSAVDDDGKYIYSPFIKSIEVKDVKDSQGNSVFETASESRVPAELIFWVPNDMLRLLNLAEDISGYSIKVNPVPRNASYSANPDSTRVESDYIRAFIESKAAAIPENTVTTQTTDTTNTNNATNNNDTTNNG